MSKSITEQIADLQDENERLKKLDKLFEKAIISEFGCDRKSIHKKLKNCKNSQSDFATKIIDYFNLKSTSEITEFLSIICSQSALDFFKSMQTESE